MSQCFELIFALIAPSFSGIRLKSKNLNLSIAHLIYIEALQQTLLTPLMIVDELVVLGETTTER